MTNTISKETYTEVVNTFKGTAEASRKVMLSDKFAEQFIENINEGLEELSNMSPDEWKSAFDEARNEVNEVTADPDLVQEIRDGMKRECDIDYDGDMQTLMSDIVEIMIAVMAVALGIA